MPDLAISHVTAAGRSVRSAVAKLAECSKSWNVSIADVSLRDDNAREKIVAAGVRRSRRFIDSSCARNADSVTLKGQSRSKAGGAKLRV
jgi:uncharacterized protein YlxP (DUF503 family)